MDGRASVGNLLTLQNLMKRDPEAYAEEFRQQYRHFQSSLKIFQLQSKGGGSKEFEHLVSFLAHVTPCFKNECKEFPRQLLQLLTNHAENIKPSLRLALTRALIMLQNRQMISRLEVLPHFFKLFRLKDKPLRELLFSHIVNDIKKVNAKAQNNKLNSTLQNFMFAMMKDENVLAARKSLDVMVELWRRKVWTGKKMVNAIATACFAKDSKLKRGALEFLLGIEHYDEHDEEDMEEQNEYKLKEMAVTKYSLKHSGNRKKKERRMKRTMKQIRASRAAAEREEGKSVADVPAIYQIYDPQTLAERLFGQLRGSGETFDLRLVMMNVISRLIGHHELILENFYPFLQKYMQPRQRHVTKILTYLAQASHKLVPPETLIPCVKTLANHFVTDRSSNEVMAVGINSIREICARAPLCISADLLADLSQYKKSKDKGVMMAARSLIALFREIDPALLHRRDRGKDAQQSLLARGQGQSKALEDDDFENRLQSYGAIQTSTRVRGAELLQGDNGIVEGEEAWDEKYHVQDDSDDGFGEFGADPLFDDEIDGEENEDENDDQSEENNDDNEQMNDAGDDDSKAASSSFSSSSSTSGVKRKRAHADRDGNDDDGNDDEGNDDDDDDDDDALPIEATRILTPADFARISHLSEQAKDMSRAGGVFRKKKKLRREDGSSLLRDETKLFSPQVDTSDIIGYVKKKKMDREERIASILAGREGRDKFGAPKAKGGGSTNAEKKRNKAFMMTKQSRAVQYKATMSSRERRSRKSTHISSLKKMAKNRHKKNRRKARAAG